MRRHLYASGPVAPRALLLALLLPLALGGCGRSDGGDGIASAGGTASPSASAGEALSNQDRAIKFAQCMRDHGVDMPDPDAEGRFQIRVTGGPDQAAKMQAAQEACRQYAPGGENGGPSGPPPENMLKFAQCMRDNGVESFPDPDGGMMRIEKSVAEDPDFEAAQEKCSKEFLPGAGGGK